MPTTTSHVQFVDNAFPSVRRRGAEKQEHEVDLGGLQVGLLQAVTSNRRFEYFLRDLTNTLAAYVPVQSAQYLDRDSENCLRPSWHLDDEKAIPASFLADSCQDACSEGRRVWQHSDDVSLLVVPVLLRAAAPEVLVLTFPAGTKQTGSVDAVAQLAAVCITMWKVVSLEPQLKADSARSQAVLGIVARLESYEKFEDAARGLVDHLRQALGCHTVALAVPARSNNSTDEEESSASRLRLAAVSNVQKLDPRSEQSRLLTSALIECSQRQEWTCWPERDDGQQSNPALTLRAVATHIGVPAVLALPLKNTDGKTVGALLFASEERLDSNEGASQFLKSAVPVLSNSLLLLKQARGGTIHGWRQRLRVLGPTPMLVAAGVLAIAMVFPVPYKVRCDLKVQPVSRRFVAAPFAGTLEKTLVEPGDTVTKGTVLATMDATELKLQHAAVLAQSQQAQKRYQSALAKGDGTEAYLAKLEGKKLQLELEQLDRRVENLEIKSPVDGIVVSGDLKRVEGAPLSVGQSLFEIGPTENMLVEVAVPENEVIHVEEGQTVDLKLNAYPGKSWSSQIQRVHPRSEVSDGASVFIAELELDNADGLLRPGMSGRAKVSTQSHMLGWNLFHRAWNAATSKLYW